MKRRNFIRTSLGAATALAISGAGRGIALAQSTAKFFTGNLSDGGHVVPGTNFASIDRKWQRQMVKYFSSEPQGTIVIDTKNHYLYMIWENNTAIRYGVGVGREGFQWFGRANVARRARWPRWVPPEEMRVRQPELPKLMEGGAKNPLGARALYLHDEKGDTGYRVHGTTKPWSIGTDASSGCIRMFNEDAIDLYRRCPIGAAVLVLEHIAERAKDAT